MSELRNVMKGGWHPKGKEGGKESWRGDFKGINQVAGWMGKGKSPEQLKESERIARPLTTLKDPSLFGPPPKNVNYHGGAALPNKITPDTRGLGKPLSQDEIEAQQRAQQAQREAEEEEQHPKPLPPRVPYRADTTGLTTNHLPPPPIHRGVAQISPQNSGSSFSKPKPSLPPRLPSRTSSTVLDAPPSPPPAYEPVSSPSPVSTPQAIVSPPVSSRTNSAQLNQGAINRLGKAGVSVPGFNIGESNPWKAEKSQPSASTGTATNGNQLNELQSRFARMNAKSPQPETAPTPPATEGTTWAQKQATMQTAQNLHKDPSSVSMQDARSAASTANNFRERHNDQIQAGTSKANALNKKYNIAGRMNNFLEKQVSPTNEQPPQPSAYGTSSPEAQALSNRKPPPPPPKKPANMISYPSSSGVASPPPVPLGTKPR